MADDSKDLGYLTEDAEAEAGEYSVLVRFVSGTSISEQNALNFLEKVEDRYGFSFGPLYTLGDQGQFNWNDKDKTKRGMARTYVLYGFPTEAEADKFASELEAKAGVEWSYRDIPVELDDLGMMDDGIDKLQGKTL